MSSKAEKAPAVNGRKLLEEAKKKLLEKFTNVVIVCSSERGIETRVTWCGDPVSCIGLASLFVSLQATDFTKGLNE